MSEQGASGTAAMNDVAFAHPPVRKVTFVIGFVSESIIRASDVASFCVSLARDYPLVRESLPRPPIYPDGMNADQEDRWILPFFEFADEITGQALRFQSDRLEIEWNFDQQTDYPGFERLRSELTKRFHELDQTLTSRGLSSLASQHVMVEYQNEIPEVAPADYIHALISGWEAERGKGPLAGDFTYLGLRHRRDIPVDLVPMHDDVSIDIDPLMPGGTILTISARSFRGDDGNVTVEELLDRAHQHEFETFLAASSSKLHATWGRQ